MATYRRMLKDEDGDNIIPAMVSVETQDIKDGAVTSNKIDFSSLWNYSIVTEFPSYPSGGHKEYSIDISSLPVGAKVLVICSGSHYLKPWCTGTSYIKYNNSRWSSFIYADNKTESSSSLPFCNLQIIQKISGVNTIGVYIETGGNSGSSSIDIIATRVG